MASLFTVETPSSGDNSDGTPGITTATTVRFTAEGEVTGIRFWATTTVSGAYTVALYQVTDAAAGGTGTLLASKVAGVAPTGGAWNEVAFDAEDVVAVTTGVLYRACVHSDAGRYVFTGAFFVSPLSNGDIVADSNGDASAGFGVLAQGTFEVNAALAFPNDTNNANCYFVDVMFTVDGEPSPAPNGLPVAVALGAPTVALGLAPAPDSLAVPVALGAPTVTLGLAPVPDSLAVPVGLGAPTIGATEMRPVTPDSLAIPLAFGDPTTVSDPAFEVTTTRGSWDSYGAALRFNYDQARLARETPPVDCPNDGEPLVGLPDGRLYCPADGWQWPARRIIEHG